MTTARQFYAPQASALYRSEPDMITIICLSFNTRDYIAQCFDALLAQQVEGRLQIVVHDDASSDGSPELIREYADRYPDVFTPILQPSNRYSLGFCPVRACMDHVRGSFVAICEVDDYWTEPDKLQRQLEYLLLSERSFVGTQCRSKTGDEEFGPVFPKAAGDGPVSIISGADIFAMRKYIHTSTFFMRRAVLDKWAEAFTRQVVSVDLTILLTACLFDDGLAVQNRVTSQYRIHDGGVWTGSSRPERYARYAATWHAILDALGAEMPAEYRRLATNNLTYFQAFSQKRFLGLLTTFARRGPGPVMKVGFNMLARRLMGN